jgi:predicted acylesterase/phospholipase RssA
MTAIAPGTEAMVVSGGGALAAYGVGIMKALLDGESPATGHSPIDPPIYTGTSSGAFNAAFMVSQPGTAPAVTIRLLERNWVDKMSDSPQRCGNGVFRIRGNPLQYLDPQCIAANPLGPILGLTDDSVFFATDLFRRGLNFLLSKGTLEWKFMGLFDISQLIDDRPFRRNLPALLDLAGIRRSEKILKIISTNWRTGEFSIFGNADLTDEIGYALLHGSASIPGVFQPIYAAGTPYVDGGLVMDVPLNPAIEAGADTLHVVYYDPDVKNVPLTRVTNTLDILNRSRMIDWAIRVNQDIDTARRINEALELIERVARGEELAAGEEETLVRVSSRIDERNRLGKPFRKLTIHRYHPRDDYAGPLGALNFDRGHLVYLIERGFTDAVAHDCVASVCVLPGRSETRR